MSIVGIGTDIVEIARINDLLAAHGDRFLGRCFTAEERAYCAGKHGASRSAAVAGRWAAKESFLKALGQRISHVPYHQIGVRREIDGAPVLDLTDQAAAELALRGGGRVFLTISHERAYAVATVVIERGSGA